MCIIALRTKNSVLSEETIRTMYRGNPDGAGVMWADGQKVCWRKGFFNVEELVDFWFNKIPADAVAAMHCRIATHGSVNKKLCHPFSLTESNKMFKTSGQTKVALMHNGIMSFMEKSKFYDKSKDSDSSAFARELFTEYGDARLPNAEELEALRFKTEAGNRILLLSGTGEFVTSGEWEFKDGILYSNSHWKESLWSSRYGSSIYGYSGYDDYEGTWPSSWKSSTKKAKSKGTPLIGRENIVIDDTYIEEYAEDCGLYPVFYGEVLDIVSGELVNCVGLYSDGFDLYEYDENLDEFMPSTKYALVAEEEN